MGNNPRRVLFSLMDSPWKSEVMRHIAEASTDSSAPQRRLPPAQPASGGARARLGARLLPVLGLLAGWASTSRAEVGEWVVSQQGPFQVTLVETAEIAAVDQVSVSAPRIWNQTLQITDLVPEGTRVEEGDFLIQLDDRESRADLDQAQDALASLEADLSETKARQSLRMSELRNSLKMATFNRQQAELRLSASQFESQARQDIARLQLRQAEIRLERTQTEIASQEIIHRSALVKLNTQLSQARARVAENQERIDALRIVAPIAGLVVYREVGGWRSRERLRKGYTAWPGETLISIPDLDRMEAQLYVNEIDWPRIRVGQPARVSLDAYPEVELPGRVVEVGKLAQTSPAPDSPPGFPVVIAIDGTRPDLKPGMTARVEILLEEIPDAVHVPAIAVFELSGQPVVFPRDRTRGVAVQLGPRNDGEIVIERGLPAGLELACRAPIPEAVALGTARELGRIAEAEKAIAKDLDILAQRGLLFEYDRPRPPQQRPGRGDEADRRREQGDRRREQGDRRRERPAGDERRGGG